MSRRLLLIEDDEELAGLLGEYMAREGYTLHTVGDGAQGLDAARAGGHDLVLLDLMLPGMGGLDVLRELRKHSHLPVIILTAKGDEVDRIVGLELGADDYLPKPFNPRELAARVSAVLRRTQGTAAHGDGGSAPDGMAAAQSEAGTHGVVEMGPLRLELDAYRAVLDGVPLELTTVEFALLRELVLARGRVLTRDVLLERLRAREYEVFDRSIDVHVSRLRAKLGDDPREPRFIRTVRSVGYAFMGEGESA